MNQFENLGIAFANIVCKFLEGIDCGDYDASLRRMFECCSREKKTLVSFLMRKKAQRYECISECSCGKWINETLTEMMRESSEQTVQCDQHGERTDSTRTDDLTETSSVTLLERSIETNAIVTQLTVVRNTFIKCLLGTRESPTSRATSSLSNHDVLQEITVEYSGGLTDSGVKSIETLIASLSNRLMRSHQFNSGNRASTIERGVICDGVELYDHNYAQLLSITVEVVWAFSLCLILAEQDSVFIRSGGLVHCARFVLRNRNRSRVRGVQTSFPRLCDLPPVFFLSLNLAISLETHFHSVLLHAGSRMLLPSGIYHLVLSHSCYGLLCQLDEQAVDRVRKGVVQTCASVMKTARLTCQTWENVDWGVIISKTGLSSSYIDYESLAQDMESIWRRRQKWWEDSTKDTSRAAEVTWTKALPIILNGTLPCFLSTHMRQTEEFVSNLYVSLKGNNNNRIDKTMGDNFNTLFCGTMQLSHIFNNQSVMQGFLKEFLDIVKRLLTYSKKDKRAREVVSIVLAGCFFFIPGTYDGRRRDAHQMEMTPFQPLVEIILSEVNNWCKPKHAMWYSISMASLLGGCSMKTLAERLPIFFETMGLWLGSADNTDRIAILYSTLHVGGLLCDVCTNPTTTALFEWGRSIEAFCNSVEKMLLKSIGDESWEETQQSPSTVAAASDLLIFSLQQEPFHSRACQWLMKLLEIKAKVKFALKGYRGTPISRGQLIAMRTISALCGLQYFPRHHFLDSKRTGTKDSNLVCSMVMEYENRMNIFYGSSSEHKGYIKDRVASLITIYGSYYNPAVTTIEGTTIFWRSDHLENVLGFVKQAKEITPIIYELREMAFAYIRHINTEGQSVETMESALPLINIFLVSRFWVSPEVVLDKQLTLPMILVGAKTPLYEVVSQVVMPFYLHNKNDSNMSSSALALHRLAECIITLLANDDDEHVEQLAEYMITHLAILRNRMEFTVNHELYADKTDGSNVPLTMESHQMDIPCNEKNENKILLCRSRWNWLLNIMDSNLHLPDDSSVSSSGAQDWCSIPGLRSAALIDILEGLSVVLLGHCRRQVRRLALVQLELLASLLHLQKIHCESAARATLNARNTNISNGVHMNTTSFSVTSNYSLYNTEVSSSRLALADIFTELSEQFTDMYASQKEHYVPLIRLFDLRSSVSRHSMDDKWGSDVRRMFSRESFTTTSINIQEKLRLYGKSTKRNTSLLTAPFGIRCLSEDNSASLFIFTSTTALSLMMYGYCPGSAVVPVSCAITGEVVEKGMKQYMERNSPVWRSCYTFYFLLLCVDNFKVSPDANRLTRGVECNRPGHQQGAKSIYRGGPDATSEVGWQIMNRHEKYHKLMKDITLPLILHEINNENNTPYFIDMLQFLLVGPLEMASTGVSSLVTFSGIMDSDHPVVKSLSGILGQINSKTRKNKQHVINASLVILMPMLIIIGRRYFVMPPATPGRMQDTVATKRTIMETIIKDFINSMLLGEHICKEYGDDMDRERGPTVEDLGKTLSEGNGVAVSSWLALPFIPPTVSPGDSKSQSNHDLYLEIRPIILLRGLLCDLIGLVYSKETKYLEPHLRNNLLPRVLYSLTYQVHWFLQGYMSSRGSFLKSKSPKSLFIAMEKSIIALQTVVSSSEPSQGGNRYPSDYKNIINTFAEKFFKWLQQASQTEYHNLEKSATRIFDLAVTLLLADSPSLEYAHRVLCELPIGSPVHRTFFALLVTALPAKSGKQKETIPSRKQMGRVELSYTKTEATSNDAFTTTHTSASLRVDTPLTELIWNPCIIFYSLVYLYEDVNAGCVFDAAIRLKAQSFLMLLCGESPSDRSHDPLDDWLCLLLKTYHHSRGELEHACGLVQVLFTIASGDILSAQRKSNNPVQIQRIALKLLTLFMRRVEPTKANLRTILQVTQSCRNSISEYALAELWGGWIAYEGRERERFVSLLVTLPLELSEKRLVTNYIDSYIAHELTKQGKAHSGKLDGRSRGAYYSFLLFSFYQMKSLRSKVIESVADNNFKTDTVDTLLDSIRDDEIRRSSTGCLSRSISQAGSQGNRKISQGGAAKRKSLWVVEENIWQSNVRFTTDYTKSEAAAAAAVGGGGGGPFMRERPMDHGASSVSSEVRDDAGMIRETGFVKPLVSVLFFASWAIERLQPLGWRLWKELDRDLGTISNFMRKESLSDAKGVTGYCPSYTCASGEGGEAGDYGGYYGNNNTNTNNNTNNNNNNNNNTTTNQNKNNNTPANNNNNNNNYYYNSSNSSNSNSSTASDESLRKNEDTEEDERIVSHVEQTTYGTQGSSSSEDEPLMAFNPASVEEEERGRGRGRGGGVVNTTAVMHERVESDTGSDGTMVVHGNIAAKSFRETIEAEMKQKNKLKKAEKRQQQLDSKAEMTFRLLQRDFLSLFLHFACMLLVHLGCGEVRRSDGRDELLLRFRVVEASFEALGGQLKGATSESSYRATSTLKHWLKLTLARIQQRNAMAQRDDDSINNNSNNNSNSNNNMIVDNGGSNKGFFGNCGDALFHDMSLLFEQVELDESLADSASSSTDVVLSELFLNIAGQGRNIRGRRFLLRCLHESTTWLQHGGSAPLSETEMRLRPPIPFSYISLLSMKIARSISSSLAFTTGVLLVSCDGRRLWMEKTAMQLAEASALRRILAALASHMRNVSNDVSASVESSLLSQDHMWCTSILTSLACLLRDIIVHETYYCTRTRTREVENDKTEEMVLTTVFGVNSAFPRRYLLLCFWIGFSFLLKSNIWHEACNLLAIFHRYGCSSYLVHISVPTLPLLNHLCVNVAPDFLAVQLALFHQGRTAGNRHRGSIISLYDSMGKSPGPTNDSVLNYLNEYANEKDECALFLAFSELLLLCDWESINVETNAPRFTAFINKLNINGGLGKGNRGVQSQGDSKSLSSTVSNSFIRYFCHLTDLWKQCLVKYSSDYERTLQTLSTRMTFLLNDFFLMGARAFGVSSIDVLLHRVIITKNNYKGSHGAGLSHSRSHAIDLCSLHSCTGSLCDKHHLSEESVALFQRLFDSLVMTPLILLFQSSKTPLSLWCKILVFVAALLSFHKQNHGYVTDLLLKFLPYLERGLSVDSTHSSVGDETPLFERFVVLFLADEVLEKLKSLKSPVYTNVPPGIGCDSRKQPPFLVSLVDDENLIAALIEYIAKDSFSVRSTRDTAQSVSSTSLLERSVMQASSLHTEEGGGAVLPIITAYKDNSPTRDDDGKEKQTAECEHSQIPSSVVPEESSSLCVKKKSSFIVSSLSHRFGEYVYEVCPGTSTGGVEMLDQLPLECYRPPLRERSSPTLDVDVVKAAEEHNKESDGNGLEKVIVVVEGEEEDNGTQEHKPLTTRARRCHSDLNQVFIPRDENVFPLRRNDGSVASLSTLDNGEFYDTDSELLDSS